jgi:hypothetical protein
VEHAPGPLVEAFDVRPANVREAKPPAREGNADLARVEMACKDQVEDARFEPVDHLREVAEEDAKVGLGIGQALRLRASGAPGTRVDADDLHLAATKLDRLGFVGKEVRRAQVGGLADLGERILADPEVVVSENGVAGGEPCEQLAKKPLTASTRQEIAADQSQVGLPLLDPIHGTLDCTDASRRRTEVEVREMCDPNPIQLGRQPSERHVLFDQPDPARFEPRVDGEPAPKRSERGDSGARSRRS